MGNNTRTQGEATPAPIRRAGDIASHFENLAFKLRALATLIGQANEMDERDYAGLSMLLDELAWSAEKAVNDHHPQEDEIPVTRRVLETLAEAACSRCSYDAEWIMKAQGMAPIEERFQARNHRTTMRIQSAFDRAHNGTQAVLPLSLVESLELTMREDADAIGS